ncbi:phage holin family protein [Parerythrobacter lacustris]|uniref:Phage holin family protein n=1 Tax=Parerythrobacter lacustris TaxID=2969984 RepID=A0ABT1XQL8_9SPHN|nr:phage holin family protein [Parerythrobacter lacustris]MCR2833936.1 phage holin family protein [Parerythrobacter lacustris]
MLDGNAQTADDAAGERVSEEGDAHRSLAEDFEALFDDGKTYAEAEFAYQKTRARLAGSYAKSGLIYGILALFLIHMVLIGLTVGAILVLAPLTGPLIATAIVTGVLLTAVVALALLAKARFGDIGAVFGGRER